jgi:hypothetical protein
MKVIDDSSFDAADSVRIMWRIQKNHQDSQTITLLSDGANPNLCPVIYTLKMVFRTRRLKQPNSMLLGCYCTKKMPMVYMVANRMASLIQEAVKKVHTRISAKDLSKYSTHLL